MAKGTVRVEMNRSGAAALLKGEEIQSLLREKADRIAAAAGGVPDFEVTVRVGATRARAIIRTATLDGMRAEAQNRTLSSALDAARG